MLNIYTKIAFSFKSWPFSYNIVVLRRRRPIRTTLLQPFLLLDIIVTCNISCQTLGVNNDDILWYDIRSLLQHNNTHQHRCELNGNNDDLRDDDNNILSR